MNILFFSDNFPPEVNAAASRVFERACYWVKWGHKVTVITCVPNFPQGKVYEGYKNKWYQTERMSGIKVIRVKTFISANEGFVLRTLDFMSYMFMAFWVALFQKKSDVIIATSPQFFAAVGGWFASFCKRVPFVFELGDLWPASIAAVGAMKQGFVFRMIEKLELFLYRKAVAVVALTNAFKKDLMQRGIPENKIAVVINGVDLSRYSPREKDKVLLEQYGLTNKFVVGYIGTHGMAHALNKVLDAARMLETKPDIHFLFVGDGAAKKVLKEQAEKMKLTNVTLIPAQPKAEMPRYWSLCDVALVSLKNTPVFETVIPSKTFEAMGMGLPVILTGPQGELSQIIESDDVGLCVPPEDEQALAAAVVRLYEDKNLLIHFARKSESAAKHHTREEQAKKMLKVLTSFVERKR